ncbi:MAG: helix-turn-helix domain-containing protein, partial [Silvanigrellaceae bacterium]|nr:helix-turn-helix domain-containing protein [Silvanigrellaceae bacterium]
SVGQLTNREKECLFWLIQGKSAQETGEILSISRRTVETLRENCRLRFGAHYTFSNLIYLLGKYDLF